MRLDHKLERLCFNGSGFPVPLLGLREAFLLLVFAVSYVAFGLFNVGVTFQNPHTITLPVKFQLRIQAR